jgi:hypothetical protein
MGLQMSRLGINGDYAISLKDIENYTPVDYHLECCIEARFWKIARKESTLNLTVSARSNLDFHSVNDTRYLVFGFIFLFFSPHGWQ